MKKYLIAKMKTGSMRQFNSLKEFCMKSKQIGIETPKQAEPTIKEVSGAKIYKPNQSGAWSNKTNFGTDERVDFIVEFKDHVQPKERVDIVKLISANTSAKDERERIVGIIAKIENGILSYLDSASTDEERGFQNGIYAAQSVVASVKKDLINSINKGI